MIRPAVKNCFGRQCLFNCEGRFCDADEIDLDESGYCKTYIDREVFKGAGEDIEDGNNTCI